MDHIFPSRVRFIGKGLFPCIAGTAHADLKYVSVKHCSGTVNGTRV